MRNLKKVLTLVLCLAMMMSIMVVGAGAAFSDQSKIENTEAVDMCVALNIINGYTDGSYKPEGNVTRAEMCKMICIALNGGKEPATATKATPTYSDIDGHWAEGYIEYCNTKGIVAGVGGGKFNPNGNVTGSQAAKMLLIALGYNADVEKYVGASWELYVNVQANQDGLYKDLETIDPSAALTRDNAAQMIWNTLQAYIIEKSSEINRNDGSISDVYTQSKVTDLLKKAYNANDEHEGILVAFTYNSTKAEWTYYLNEDDNSLAKYTSSTDYTDLYAQYVTVVYKEKSNSTAVDTVYGIYADADDCQVLASGLIGDLADVENDKGTVKISGTTYDVNAKTQNTLVYFFQNSNSATGTYALNSENNIYELAKKDAKTLDAFEFSAIDLDADDDIDYFVVYPYAVGQVNTLNATKIGLKSLTDSAAADVTGSTFVEDLDDVAVYSGVAKDDYVKFTPKLYTATNKDLIEQADSVLTGKVTRTSGSTITIDDAAYKNLSNKANADFSAGGRVTDGVVVNGYIFLVDSTGAVSADDYVVVTNADVNGYGATAKLMFADGTKTVVDLDVVYNAEGGKINLSNKDAVAGIVGYLYTYEKNSDDEYTLTPAVEELEEGAENNTGFDGVYSGAKAPGDLNSSNKVKYLNGMNISDDAVIYLHHGSSYKVISGAQLKTTDGSNITGMIAYYDFDNSKGANTVQVAYVTMSQKVQSADSTYGYVLADAAGARNDDNEKCYEITVWTTEGEKTYLTDGSTAKFNVSEGDVIKYTVNSDGEIDDITLAVATGSSAAVGIKQEKDDSDNVIGYYGLVPIVSKYGDDLQFEVNGARYSIEKDTVILYVDNNSDPIKGYTDGSVTLASENTAGGYYTNAVFYCDSATDGEIDLLVIDINNDMQGKM